MKARERVEQYNVDQGPSFEVEPQQTSDIRYFSNLEDFNSTLTIAFRF